jgi:hypothetical protein
LKSLHLNLIYTLFALLFAFSQNSKADALQDMFKAVDHLDKQAAAEKRKSEKERKRETQGKAGCVICNTPKAQIKTADQRNYDDVIQETQKQAKKDSQDCIIGCRGNVKVKKNGTLAINEDVHGEDYWSQQADVMAYSNSSKTKTAIKSALAVARPRNKGFCFRKVKLALLKGKLIDHHIDGDPVFPDVPSRARRKSGRNALVTLDEQHFTNLLEDPRYADIVKNPASAPKGAVLIYRDISPDGGNGGHIEIKTDWGTKASYVSDHMTPEPITKNELAGQANGYKLVGVMVKKAEYL